MKKRHSHRKAATYKVTFSCNGRVGDGHIVNLSVPGCQMVTTVALAKRDCVQARIQLSQYAHLRVDLGVVRWSEGGHVGIEFIRMTAEDQARLRAHLGHVAIRVMPSRSWSEAITYTDTAGNLALEDRAIFIS